MKRSTTPWTTAAAAAALLALPAAGWSQTTQQPPTAGAAQTQTQDQTARGDNDEAREHLREARAALDRIDNETLTGEAQRKVAELKRHFSALERSIGANDRASATGAAQRSERATEPRGHENWQTEVAAIDRLLTDLIGPATGATGAVGTTGTTGTTGAVGTTGAAATAIALDESSRQALEEVRRHVAKFAARQSGAGDAHPHRDAADDTAAAATTGTTAATAQTDTTAAQAAAQAQVDTDAARRHLTEARNTLSEMTQLPAAAQLSGEARTQVSQLIANFNELITTQENWRAAYAKVTSNLDALLGPDSATMTGTTGTTGTGTAGTVGTTGAAAEDLDPELRQRLVELRRQLNEFERAAGGGSPAATDPAATGAMTGAVTPDPAAATAPAAQAAPHGAPGGHLDQGEMMRHIEAIEAILNANDPMAREPGTATGTTGTAGTAGTTGTATAAPAQPPTGAAGDMAGEAVTLSRAQIEQLRLHLNQLRGLVQR